MSAAPGRRSCLALGRRFALVAALVAGAGALATPVTATAAEYTVYQCRDLQKPAEVTAGFFSHANASVYADNCASGGQVEITVANNTLSPFGSQDQFIGYAINLPASLPSSRITGITSLMSVAAKKGDVTLSRGFLGIHGDPGGVLSRRDIPAGDWPGFTDETEGAAFPGGGSRYAHVLVHCYGPCDFQSAPTIRVKRVAITINDPAEPNTAAPHPFGLFDGAAQRGVRPVRITVGDADSGVSRVELRTADGTLMATTPNGAACTYTRPSPCPQVRSQEELSVDTTKLPEGAQSLKAWVVDAAGNVLKADLPTITVDNVPDPVPPPAARPKATVGFKVSNRSPRRGQKIKLFGTVTPAPSKGARVVIEAKKGKHWITAAVVRTRAAGAFTWSHSFKTRGTYRMRARLLGTADPAVKPGSSSTRTFRVR